MKNVITIEANAPRNSELASISLPKKRRVAGYARVSTDHEDQTTSYEAIGSLSKCTRMKVLVALILNFELVLRA